MQDAERRSSFLSLLLDDASVFWRADACGGTALASALRERSLDSVGERYEGSAEKMEETLETRVELLESTVAGLSQLPEQLDKLSSQFVQLRTEVREDILPRVPRCSGCGTSYVAR